MTTITNNKIFNGLALRHSGLLENARQIQHANVSGKALMIT
jgi:hypothetical protein